MTGRFSDFAGFPAAPDNDPNISSPRGLAVRFNLGDHVHTDIVAHSADGFPVRTAEEFVEFLRAVHASGPDAPHPNPIEQFLGGHPKALAFVQMPKPIPTSFARESYFSVTAYKFIDATGAVRHVRYRILPDAGNEYLSAEGAAAKGPNFLMEELEARLASGPIKMNLWVQIAAEGDIVDDATEHWPAERPQTLALLGVITFTGLVPADDAEGRRIIFDPIPRVEGIEPSADPLLEPRADAYFVSGRRPASRRRPSSPVVWIVTALFIVSLILAHLTIGIPRSLRMHMSEMRPLTIFGHFLFLLVIAGAALLRPARQRNSAISSARRSEGSSPFPFSPHGSRPRYPALARLLRERPVRPSLHLCPHITFAWPTFSHGGARLRRPARLRPGPVADGPPIRQVPLRR